VVVVEAIVVVEVAEVVVIIELVLLDVNVLDAAIVTVVVILDATQRPNWHIPFEQ
jgi:hypothetical protein